MNEKKIKEKLLEPLNALRKEKNAQDIVVRRFQALIQAEGWFSQTIKDFPYPVAVFRKDGTILFVSSTLTEETGLYIGESPAKRYNILNRITDSNFQILDAAEDVFSGKTSFLVNLFDPLAMFIGESSGKKTDCSKYQSAIFFPIAEEDGQITYGTVIFILSEHFK